MIRVILMSTEIEAQRPVLRTFTVIDGDTFVRRLANLDDALTLDEKTDETTLLFPCSSDEANLLVSNRSIFPYDSRLLIGQDGLSLWWLNASSIYGAITLAELEAEDKETTTLSQRKADLLGESAVKDEVSGSALKQESRLRQHTRRKVEYEADAPVSLTPPTAEGDDDEEADDFV